MKLFIAILTALLLITSASYSQTWHNASDTLKLPSMALGNGESTMAFVDGYDTVRCFYKVIGAEVIYSGYKAVYEKKGYYIDDFSTINILFDDKMQRIFDVKTYTLGHF